MMEERKARDKRPFLATTLILLTAVSLRLYRLGSVPPGLTHDEADHGITAWHIVKGARDIYFTIGYGREPFYDYATAALMALVGPTYLALRVTAVALSLIMLAGMVAWTRRAFDTPTALLTGAGLAVGFWSVMAARQGLRSIALPALLVPAVYLFWRGLETRDWRLKIARTDPISNLQSPISYFAAAGLLLGLSVYTYIPARGMWLLFPAVWGYLWLVKRPLAQRRWRGLALMLVVAGVVAAPLLWFLHTHPTIEVRIDELSLPLREAANGDFERLLANVTGSLRLFTIAGDTAWRYNIPQRPFLGPILGALFYLGLAVALWRALFRQSAACFAALIWLLLGVAPVLVTGPELATTQAIGMQPVLYLLPALAIVEIGRLEIGNWRFGDRWVALALVVVLFVGVGARTVRDYFWVWANAPEVRVQYESTTVAIVDYVNENAHGDVAISTVTPLAYHTPALAQLMLADKDLAVRWFDGRGSLLVPDSGQGTVIFSGFATLAPELRPYWQTAELSHTLPLRATDLDRPVRVYAVESAALRDDWMGQMQTVSEVAAGDVAQLRGYHLQTPAVTRGGTVRLVTWWRVKRPLPHARLFTHMQGADGAPLAQADGLDAPGEHWQPDDMLLQLHEFVVPAATAVGDYPLAIGLYTTDDGRRLPITVEGTAVGDMLPLTTVRIEAP